MADEWDLAAAREELEGTAGDDEQLLWEEAANSFSDEAGGHVDEAAGELGPVQIALHGHVEGLQQGCARPSRKRRRGALLREALAEVAQAPAPAFDRAEQLAVARNHIKKRCVRGANTTSAGLQIAGIELPRLPVVPREVMNAIVNAAQVRPPLWPLGPFIKPAFLAAQQELGGVIKDDEFRRIANWYLGGRTGKVSSKVCAADALDVDRRKLGSSVQRLANTLVHADHEFRWTFEQALINALAEGDLLCYIDMSRSDETPMPVTVNNIPRYQPEIPDQPPGTSVVIHDSSVQATQLNQRRRKTPTKILQSEQRCGILVRSGNGDIVAFLIPTLTWLQLMDRTTGECLVEADNQRTAVSDAAKKFKYKMRLSVFDSAKSNPRSEKAITAAKGPDWAHLSFACEVHMTANNFRKVSQFPPDKKPPQQSEKKQTEPRIPYMFYRCLPPTSTLPNKNDWQLC